MEASTAPLRQQLDTRLDQLTPTQQQHVLQLLNELLGPKPATAPTNHWAHLGQLISAEDAFKMEQAIADGPGKVNPLNWPELHGK